MTSTPKKKLRSLLSSKLALLLVLGMALGVYACYPGGATNVEDFDLVVTAFLEEFAFGAQSTYSMPDSVILIDSTQTIDSATEMAILNKIDANMQQKYGWTKIANPTPSNQPDVVLLPFVTSQDWAAFTSYPWWGYWGWWGGWGYYPPGYGPGWGWGYPPSGGTAYEYTVGTLIIDMALAIPPTPADSTLVGVWTAGINGVVTGSQSTQRLEDAIDQAFAQSPYLDQN